MNTGTGPGAITPDGCAVELYALLPAGPEPQIISEAIATGATILELGCGTGRITSPLVKLGHPVVAVDESPEMLAHVRGAETVCARIQDLRLTRRFDAVLLASHLINADSATRRAFLQTCRWHLAPGGCVIIQRYPAAWFRDTSPSETTRAGITFRTRGISRPEPGALAATVEYVVGDRVWTHSFIAMELSGEHLKSALAEADLRVDAYLTPDRSWLRAITLPCAVPESRVSP